LSFHSNYLPFRSAVTGLRDGTFSTDGLDAFGLGYEFVRDGIGIRRDHLQRLAGQGDSGDRQDGEERLKAAGTPRFAGPRALDFASR